MAMMTTLLDVCPPSACKSSSFFGGNAGVAFYRVPKNAKASSSPVHCSARAQKTFEVFQGEQVSKITRQVACGLCAAATVLNMWSSIPLASAAMKLPPLSTDPDRCEKAFVGNTIGQANGVADKLLDLRFCDYTNDKKNLKGKTLSAALMPNAKFDDADMTEVIMSKAYAVGASFKGTDFTNAVLDRVAFDGSNLQGANFKNAILSGSTFVNANLEDSSFEDVLIGYVDIQKLCKNTTLSETARTTLGCKG